MPPAAVEPDAELSSQAVAENKPRGAPPGRFAGERVRAGSSRPPHITSEIWNNMMSHPQRVKAAREYRQELAAKAAIERARVQDQTPSSDAVPAPVLTSATVCSEMSTSVLTDELLVSSGGSEWETLPAPRMPILIGFHAVNTGNIRLSGLIRFLLALLGLLVRKK